jgi:molecular chaperone GrpE
LEFRFFNFFTKKRDEKTEKLRRSIAFDVQKISSEMSAREKSLLEKYFSSVTEHFVNFEGLFAEVDNRLSKLEVDHLSNFENLLTNVDGRLSKLEEDSRQAARQERRRQTALESLFEQQQKILEILERPQMSPPLEALMALAENFALAWKSPRTPAIDVLYGKLTELMECFGLSLVEETSVGFDPEIHEACGTGFDPFYPENTVLEIVSPGFLLNGKVLRCAIVIVNRQGAARVEEPLMASGKNQFAEFEPSEEPKGDAPEELPAEPSESSGWTTPEEFLITPNETRFSELGVSDLSRAALEEPPAASNETCFKRSEMEESEMGKPSEAGEPPLALDETRFSELGEAGKSSEEDNDHV